MMRMGPEWMVPQQYSNSPIVQELAESAEENFIVRASSKPSCMAISVRLSNEHDTLTDHYIVQYNSGSAIRLENSPFSFRSLPLLIEHYCLHAEELQVALCLPYAVLSCETAKELRSLALMGQGQFKSDILATSGGEVSGGGGGQVTLRCVVNAVTPG
ncbi:unnamed protein product [Nippostrongylus brasiliensis]|uniref:SH2 domain-containing protein n=1 Tax=Nippostrongylus brasiliensis TaxID=27835 RepID=A0A0N4XEC5_NIPBR|nr:unnamed protein product [Nippostrongylus brasiliensis]